MKSRKIVFTVFEEVKLDDDDWRLRFEGNDQCLFLLVGDVETCPDTGRQHRHGIAHFRNPVGLRGRSVRALVGPRTHVERQRGNNRSAIEYAEKEGSWIRFGQSIRDQQGHRNDFEQVLERLRDGATPEDIDMEMPSVAARYAKWIGRVFAQHLREKQRRIGFRDVRVHVFWGPTGVGKSRAAFNLAKDLGEYYVFPFQRAGNCWFDGYRGQDVLLIDEFEGEVPLNMLLRLLDGHPCTVEVKGSVCYPLWTHVIITSNSEPAAWYSMAQDHKRDALLRRCTDVVHMQ